MIRNTYPTVDSSGWLTSPNAIAECILADYAGTNYSQSAVHYGTLLSLSKAIQNNPNDMDGVAIQVRTDLEQMFNNFLYGVEVQTRSIPQTDENGVESGSRYNLQMGVWYDTSNGRDSLMRAISITDNKIITRLHVIERLG